MDRAPGLSPPPLRDCGDRAFWQRALEPAEWLFSRLAGSLPVPGSRGTFLVAHHRHHGPDVDLPDGARVRRGDLVAEIHFWNRGIARRRGGSAQSVTWGIIRDMRADLGALAAAMQSGACRTAPVYAASPLAEAAVRFGFLVRPLPGGLRRKALSAWQRLLRRAFRPAALRTELQAETSEVWMSAADLLRRYGTPRRVRGGSPGPSGGGRAPGRSGKQTRADHREGAPS